MSRENDVTPEPILQILSGYMASQQLFVANEIGIFEALADGPATLNELAERTGTPPYSTAVVADGVAALGLLERDGERYQNTPETFTFLSGCTPADLRPLLRLNREIQYPDLVHYADAIQADQPLDREFTEEEQRLYSEGIAAVSGGAAQALAASYEFDEHRRVLDLGGGLGTFLSAALRQHDQLEGTLFDRAGVVELARERLDGAPLAERARFTAGDFFADPLPAGHDAIILANIVHNFRPGPNTRLLRHVREHAASDARLLLVDFWTDPTHTEPPFLAILASMLYLYSGGKAYSAGEVEELLEESGWRPVDHRPLAGPMSLIVAETAA